MHAAARRQPAVSRRRRAPASSAEAALLRGLRDLCRLAGAAWGGLCVQVGSDHLVQCEWGDPAQAALFPGSSTPGVRRARVSFVAVGGRASCPASRDGERPAVLFPVRWGRVHGTGMLSGGRISAPGDPRLFAAIDTAGRLLGAVCQGFAPRRGAQEGAGRGQERACDRTLRFLLGLASGRGAPSDADGAFRWIALELGRLFPVEEICFVSLPGRPTARRARAAGLAGGNGRGAAWAQELLARRGAQSPRAGFAAVEIALPAPCAGRAARSPRGAFRWTWETGLASADGLLGAFAVRLRRAPGAPRQAARLFAAAAAHLERLLCAAEDRERIRALAMHDALTGLYNYRAFQDLFQREFERYLRHGRNLALVLLDLDNFKPINDTFGHRVGDQVLRKVAEVIRNNLRKTDYAFRYGGDEFAILMAETDAERASVLADRIRAALAREVRSVHPAAFTLSASAGIADCTVLTSREREELLVRADGALYRAKNEGRNLTRTAQRAGEPPRVPSLQPPGAPPAARLAAPAAPV